MTRHRLTLMLIAGFAALLTLSGCVAYPVDGYSPGPSAYVYAPPPSVYVGSGWGYRGGWGGWGHGGGHRNWGHGGGRHWR